MMNETGVKTCGGSYVEWGAVIAGAVLASAISVVLLQFGGAIGLGLTTPLREGVVTTQGVLAAGIWALWIQITASVAGGYLAGRLRRPMNAFADHEREVRDGAHGLLVWATGTVAVFVLMSAAGAVAALAPEHADSAADMADDLAIARKNAGVIFAFGTAAVALISGVAAWWAAAKGGEHRDNSTEFAHFSFRKR